MENLTVREATPRDYDEVLAIREVYGGRDYLKDSYHDIMRRHKGFVVILNNEIVGFKFACIIDGGMTLIKRAARVHKDYEGKGVNRALDTHIQGIYGQSIQFEAVSFHDRNEYLFKKMNDGQLNVTFQREEDTFSASTAHLRDNPSVQMRGHVERLDCKGIQAVFSSDSLRRTLFPRDRLVSFWVPMRVMDENIEDILGEGGIVLGSDVGGDTNDCSKALFSIGHSYSSSIGRLSFIDVYGTDTTYLRVHLARHLREIITGCPENQVVFEIFSEPEMKEEIKLIAPQLGLSRHEWNDPSAVYSTMTCVEYDLKGK